MKITKFRWVYEFMRSIRGRMRRYDHFRDRRRIKFDDGKCTASCDALPYLGTKKTRDETPLFGKSRENANEHEGCFRFIGNNDAHAYAKNFSARHMRFQTVSNFTVTARLDYINYLLLVNSALYDCSTFEKKGEEWLLQRAEPIPTRYTLRATSLCLHNVPHQRSRFPHMRTRRSKFHETPY